MPAVENTMKTKLEAGGLAVGFSLVATRLVSAAGIAKACGYDWLFIDCEHSTMDLDVAAQICVAALPTGVTPLVRVAGHDGFHASRILDGGAMGVVVPHVDTAEQARRIVGHCRFPPLGHRSLTAPAPQLGWETLPTADALAVLNRNIVVVVMLETPDAIENADDIAAVEGVDALLIGTNDLAAAMGIPGQLHDARIEAAYGAMIQACRAHGKHPGMGGIYEHALMEKYVQLGVRLLLGGGDVAFMMQGARERRRFLDSIAH